MKQVVFGIKIDWENKKFLDALDNLYGTSWSWALTIPPPKKLSLRLAMITIKVQKEISARRNRKIIEAIMKSDPLFKGLLQ